MHRRSVQQYGGKRGKELVEQIICYIDAHLLENLSASTLAKVFLVSKSNLDCVFKKSQGCTLYAYVMKKRLLWARQKIKEGNSAGEVAYLCGFTEYSSFYRQYKRMFGVSPKIDIINNQEKKG